MQYCRLLIALESRQERTVSAITSPSHGEAHPYKDHAEHNALHIKLNKWLSR